MNRRSLLQAFGAGAAMSLAPPAAFAQGNGRWLKLESPNFIYYSSGDEAKAREEVLALERFNGLLKRLMPGATGNTLKLSIHNTITPRELETSMPGVGSSVKGFYQAEVETIRAVSASHRGMERQQDVHRSARAMDGRAVLFHEYVHHQMRANNKMSYPPWYTEGYAEFLSTAEFSDTTATVGKVAVGRAEWLVNGRWLPIETFLTKHPGEFKYAHEVAQFYAHAWLVTHYIFTTPGRAQAFDAYTRAVRDGGDLLGSFQPAFGMTPQQFDAELREYKKRGIVTSPLPDPKPAPPTIIASRLGRSADNLILQMSFLGSLPSRERARDTVAHVRNEVKKHGADPYARQCGAFVEVWYGDLGTARTQIDALLAENGASADLHHLSGLCYLRAGRISSNQSDFMRAQEAFTRAHEIDGRRPQTMFRFVEACLATAPLDAELTQVLLLAYQLAPQVDAIALTTASALIAQRRFKEAEILLRPLVSDTHNKKTAREATALSELAKSQTEGALSFVGPATISDKDEDDENES